MSLVYSDVILLSSALLKKAISNFRACRNTAVQVRTDSGDVYSSLYFSKKSKAWLIHLPTDTSVQNAGSMAGLDVPERRWPYDGSRLGLTHVS